MIEMQYEIEVCLQPESEGGYSVYLPRLAGVVSEGETKTEALRNIGEALTGALQTYEELNEEVPWRDSSGLSLEHEIRAWITLP